MDLSGKTYHIQLNQNRIITKLLLKLVASCRRILDLFLLIPKRFLRLTKHIWNGLTALRPRQLHWWESEFNKNIGYRIGMWWTQLMILLLELFGIGELYEAVSEFTKFNTRTMTEWEIKLAQTVFGNTIDYKRIRIDEYALLGPKQHRFCYVSFYTINSWGKMQNSLLLHELTHVWQYEQMGAVYMAKALSAQGSAMGYNYGGVTGLKAYLEKGRTIHDFNLEQQGDIVADYYKIREGYRPQWGSGKFSDLPLYEAFVKDIKS